MTLAGILALVIFWAYVVGAVATALCFWPTRPGATEEQKGSAVWAGVLWPVIVPGFWVASWFDRRE